MAQINVSLSGFEQGEKLLALAPVALHAETKKGLRRAGGAVVRRAKQLVPQPGYPGDKPGLKPLRDTLGVEVKEGRTLYAVVGPKRPAGAHGHLVEESHAHYSQGQPTGTVTEGKEFMAPAAESTKPQQNQALSDAIRETHRILGRG